MLIGTADIAKSSLVIEILDYNADIICRVYLVNVDDHLLYFDRWMIVWGLNWIGPMSVVRWMIISVVVALSWSSANPSRCSEDDLQALRDVSSSFANSSINVLWSNDRSCCEWEGVGCEDSRVVSLNLSFMDLHGVLPPSLGALDALKSLNICCNHLYGEMFKLSKMKVLESLDISYNGLSGEVDSVISSLPLLRYVNLSSNFFSSKLPRELKLLEFNASNNSFNGSVPNFIGVRVADLSSNLLAGNLDGLKLKSSNSSLQELHLDRNRFSGPLPDVIYSIHSLVHLCLSYNSFSGTISSDLNRLRNLKTLYIDRNSFVGSIPDAFGNLTKLEEFVAQINFFNGTFPSSLSLCSNLRVLNLKNNSISGSISSNFSNLCNLQELDLASNKLDGPIPSSLSNCSQLRTLSLAKNRFNGSIPEGFSNLSHLSYLTLSNNSLTNLGQSLSFLQNSGNLSTMILSLNFHEEEIPTNIVGFENLTVLALGNCQLRGEVPAWIISCKKLKVLDLSWNRISGSIPANIGVMENLFYIDLSNNSLSGELPVSLSILKSLSSFYNSSVTSQPGIPLLVKQNVSNSALKYNQISSFPPSIYLSNNNINGTILPGIGNLKQLHNLDLKKNNLTGTIPDSLSKLQNLEILDLSSNHLTGSIPADFTSLSFLRVFSVANNSLEGRIPTNGQFSSFPNSSFAMNPNLCGREKPCKADSQGGRSSRISVAALLGIIFAITLVLAVVLIVTFVIISKREFTHVVENVDDETNAPCSASESRLVLYKYEESKDITMADLLKSTNNFNQSNIIGCGGFGLVYKASLPNGTKAAIKKLSGDCGQMEREFHAEVDALSRACHKNLVPLKGYCCHGTDKFLIYSYMENGSLDYWLHESQDGPSLLTWDLRLNIARGSARGLAYLHDTCDPHIVHRDVKSSNILLDEKFEAHLADFGLARLLRPCETHVTTDFAGTLGYIPPEYSQTLTVTCRGDVYSYGVVLLELVTGRRPVEIVKGKNSRDMVTWVFEMRREGREKEIVDGAMWDESKEKEIYEMIEIACNCLHLDPRKRPLIEDVCSSLHSIRSSSQSL